MLFKILFAALILLAFSRIYRWHFACQLAKGTETAKRQCGQVTGMQDASKVIARHGLVADQTSGRFYSQHRHSDAELQSDSKRD